MSDADRVRALVAEVLDVPAERVGPETGADDLEAWDSLGHLRILLALEEEFGVSVDMESAAELDSVAKLLDWLRRAT